jgi:hypothetical protein
MNAVCEQDKVFENEIHDQLTAGEKLLWSGRPAQGLRLHQGDVMAIPYSVLWLAFSVYWVITVGSMGVAPFYLLFGMVFVVIGLYLLLGRFCLDAARRKNTLYAVTNQRVIIISGIATQSTKSLSIDTLSDVSLTEHANGTGTIYFGAVPNWFYWQRSITWPGYASAMVPSFELIENPQSVFDTIREAQREARGVHS